MRLRCGPDSCAGQHFVEDAAERINIRAGIGRFALPLLRRHVGRRAHHHAAGGDGFILARFRQPEIQNLDAGFRDHDVAGLEIAMNDALAVRLDQRSHNLRGIEERRLHRKRSALQPGRDRLALHQFHHQVVRPNVVERADVGVVQRRNRARLALETGAELLASGLDGDGAA